MVHLLPGLGVRQAPIRCCVGRDSSQSFGTSVTDWLNGESVRWRSISTPAAPSGRLLVLRDPTTCATLVLHLLSTPTAACEVLPIDATSYLSDLFAARSRARRLIHLWEDQWRERPLIVRSRLLACLGRTRREFGRRTSARRIDAATLDAFLLANHLWGPTKSRYRYGLYTKPTGQNRPAQSQQRRVGADGGSGGDGGGGGSLGADGGELVAVASFSARRHMPRTDGRRSRSHELIRYCSRRGESVVGGISKLVAAFAAEAEPDDIVTVVDRDWSNADGWRSLGFVTVQRMQPVTFYVGRDGLRCHPGTGPNPHRRRLPPELVDEFERDWRAWRQGDARNGACHGVDHSRHGGELEAAQESEQREAALPRFLAERSYFAVHDAGAERLLLVLRAPSP